MDLKISRFDVADEQVCLEQTIDIPMDADFTTADYLGEIARVLKCRITPYIESKQLRSNTITITGTAQISVIYLDKNGALTATEQDIPFQKTIEGHRSFEGGNAQVFTSATLHSCRAVTERRFSVKGAVRLETTVTAVQKTPILSDIDHESFESLRGEAPASLPLGMVEKTMVLDEEIHLPDALPAIYRILRKSADAAITDCKIVGNKVMIKGTVSIDISYCSNDNEWHQHPILLPFNQMVDFADLSEECECNAKVSVCGLTLSPRTAQNGECRSLMAVCKLALSVAARCNQSVPILFDAYSTRYPTELKKSDVSFKYIIAQSRESFLCKKRIALPEHTSRVLDLWCDLSNVGAHLHPEGFRLHGVIGVSLLTVDTEGQPTLSERSIDFEYPIALEGESHSPVCHPEIKISSCHFTPFGGEEVELQVELLTEATVYDSRSISLITDLSVDETSPLTDEAALIAYFAEEGENVWEISKQFLANRKELLELNHLTDEIVLQPKMLLIPRM